MNATVASSILLVSAVLAGIVTFAAWRRRSYSSAAPVFTLFMLACTVWCLTYSIHWSSIPRPFELFWLNSTYLGVVTVPLAYLLFVLQYTGKEALITPKRIIYLAVEPILALLFLWTDSYHGLFYRGLDVHGNNAILHGGPAFWVNTLYSYLLILIAFIILVRFAVRAKNIYRKQAVVLLAGSLIPWLSSVISLTGLNPLPSLDLTPFAFTFTGLAFAYALFNLQFLNLVPVARATLVEVMSDGVFVVDQQNRVVDINKAAQTFLGISSKSIGKDAEWLFRNTPDLVSLYRSTNEGQFEFFTEFYGQRYLDMRIVPLRNRKEEQTGKLFIFRDVTQQKHSEMEISNANNRLQEQLREIESLQAELRRQAILDSLTGLYNRRYLEEFLRRELARAEREETPLAILMLDIDHFKNFNDTHGHRAGDAVLIELGRLLRESTRDGGDIACRYGGEEFVIVMSNTSREVALRRADEIRKDFQSLRIPLEELELSATASIGIAIWPDDGLTAEKVLHSADNALYRAKEQGRNCIQTCC